MTRLRRLEGSALWSNACANSCDISPAPASRAWRAPHVGSSASLAKQPPEYPQFLDIAAFDTWTSRWHKRLAQDVATPASRAAAMQQANPAYIPRNHKVEEALTAAVERSDYAPFEQLLVVPGQLFTARDEWAEYAQSAMQAQAQGYQTFCGT